MKARMLIVLVVLGSFAALAAGFADRFAVTAQLEPGLPMLAPLPMAVPFICHS